MAVTTVVGSIIKYIDAENQTTIHPKTVGQAVSVDRSGNSNVPSSVANVQTLVAALGALAFKSSIANATTGAAGLMSAADKTKLDGIAANANNYTHPNSGVTAGTYTSVTVNAQGHITAGTKPTTLAGYGITDAASKTHQHGDADITAISASKITGVIDISHIPQGALERVVTVEDDDARKALTTSQVQKGDVVHVTSTGLMYFVVDDTKLAQDAGYQQFTAGQATSVPWSGITGKPSTFTPSTHTHTIANVTNLQTTLDGKAANKAMTGAGASSAGTMGLVPAPAAGASNRYLRSDGTWVVPPDTNTTYSPATASANGLLTAADFKKLQRFTEAEAGYLDGVTSSIQTQLNAKAANKAMTGAGASSAGTMGLVPAPTAGASNRYLRSDGTWAVPPDTNTTYTAFKGATSGAAGGLGLVPAPQVADLHDFLCGDGTWKSPMDDGLVVGTTTPSYSCLWIKTA